MSWKIISIIGATLLLSFAGVKVISDSKTDYKEERVLVALRKMGHDILLQYGDSSSRILPIEKRDDHTYLIKFENPFSFTPDSLVRIVDQYAQTDHLPEKYLVEVIDRTNEMVNYSYEISDALNIVIPCVGRDQPKGNYYVKIHFEGNPTQNFSIAYIFPYLFLPLAIVLLITGFKGSQKKIATRQTLTPKLEDETVIHLGDFTYSMKNQILRKGTERIALSAKEAKILSIFAAHPNEILDRDDLLKEVWENEGVFVGRSLDVFVSKLRKKLQSDTKIRIVNIHGKGYKLEVLASGEKL
ncbi:MAG TPA: winged helix-turn-helix domain-containing protein [Cytophagales bacterium]|nr:winged helix-turn-helix domain-containing protein [Cytophagales bacterium]